MTIGRTGIFGLANNSQRFGDSGSAARRVESFPNSQRPPPESCPARAEIPKIAGQKLGRVRLTRENIANGYVWRETTYASLSTIARAITGTAWTGPRFFGLRSGGKPAASSVVPDVSSASAQGETSRSGG